MFPAPIDAYQVVRAFEPTEFSFADVFIDAFQAYEGASSLGLHSDGTTVR